MWYIFMVDEFVHIGPFQTRDLARKYRRQGILWMRSRVCSSQGGILLPAGTQKIVP
jgi:hypothetical protein